MLIYKINNKSYYHVKSGVGQLTSFNQLGFKGVSDKPDGWYLPKNIGFHKKTERDMFKTEDVVREEAGKKLDFKDEEGLTIYLLFLKQKIVMKIYQKQNGKKKLSKI